MERIQKKRFITRAIFISLCFLVLLGSALSVYTNTLPNSVAVFCFDDVEKQTIAPFVSLNCSKTNTAEAKLFGIVKLKDININLLENKEVYVGGMPFGLKMYTDGILISGTSEVDSESGNIDPARSAGIKAGDIIKKIDKKEVYSISDVYNAAKESKGKTLVLQIERGGELYDVELTPVKSKSEKEYKLGLWIKDGTAGIGTVTFIDPETKAFGGLGHGVCDADTGKLIPMSTGKLSEIKIQNIEKGKKGIPGELQGYFYGADNGVLISNTDYGVFGVFNTVDTSQSKKMKIGLKNELKEGPATILCTLSSNTICKYSIEIEKINKNSNSVKNFTIKVTDKALLNETGGIVQGMSGSPIIQDGKLVGAVTHVLVDDPTRGYGIYIENMLEAAG